MERVGDMATAVNINTPEVQLGLLKSILNELSLDDRYIEHIEMNYDVREIPGDGPRVQRVHTGVRTYTIRTVPKWAVGKAECTVCKQGAGNDCPHFEAKTSG